MIPAIERITGAARRAPRQTAVLCVLVLVMGVLWVRVLSGSRDAVPALAATAQAQEGPVAAPGTGEDRDERLDEWASRRDAELGRNPFVFQKDFYPQGDGREAPPTAASNPGFWEDLAKSVSAQADQKKERRILVQNLTRKASELRLQGIFKGPRPQAMVNGELVEEGSVVAGFRVLEIGTRQIIVEREGVRLAIGMN